MHLYCIEHCLLESASLKPSNGDRRTLTGNCDVVWNDYIMQGNTVHY